jgi:hypothetical protein
MFLAVDNLPSELPKEASKYFGDHLMPWLEELAWSDGTLAIQNTDLPGELSRLVNNITFLHNNIEQEQQLHLKENSHPRTNILMQ